MKSADQIFARNRQRVALLKNLQYVGKGRGPQEGHAQGLKWIGAVGRIDWDNVGVLELGEGLGFGKKVRGDFQGDMPAGQILLLGQEHASKCPSAKLAHQPEIQE